MSWELHDSTLPDAAAVERNGSRFVAGNGLIGLRGTLDEAGADDKACLLVNGLYDQVPGAWREPVNAPYPCRIALRVAGKDLALPRTSARKHDHWLDYRHGLQMRETGFVAPGGAVVTVHSTRFVEAGTGAQVRLRYRLAVSEAVEVELDWGIDGRVWDINGPHLGDFSAPVLSERLILACRTREEGRPVLTGVAVTIHGQEGASGTGNAPAAPRDGGGVEAGGPANVGFGGADGHGVTAGVRTVWMDQSPGQGGPVGSGPVTGSLHSGQEAALPAGSGTGGPRGEAGAPSLRQSWTFRAEPGIEYGIDLVARVSHGPAGVDPLDLVPAMEAALADAAGTTFQAALTSHCDAWDRAWARADVRIHGDEVAQEGLRFSVYHLLAIVPPAGARGLSIPARGLSGQVYKGGIFWDTELFMVPFFLATFPVLARNLLDYRVATLGGARRKAASYGYQGAYFAWESQETGDDACTLFNVNDVFTGRPMRTFFRDRQIHISADMAWAVGRYVEVTGDLSFLREGGLELVIECARFLWSWLWWKPGKERYEVLDVTGPDEYHERVHNDYFSNRMVAEAFRVCLDLCVRMEAVDRAFVDALLARLGGREELDRIREASAHLYVPAPGADTGVIPQFDDYHSLEDVPLATVLGRKLHPHEYLGGGNGLARWTTIIKQADVVLALALFPEDHSAAIRRTNWDFYEPRTEHGSSLSACAYAVAACGLGEADRAYPHFMKTALIDWKGEGKQYVGDLYIGGTHPAANGGAWLTALHGFAGLRWTPDGLALAPCLPRGWAAMDFCLVCRHVVLACILGQDLLRVAVSADQGHISDAANPATGAPCPDPTLTIGTRTYPLVPGTTIIHHFTKETT